MSDERREGLRTWCVTPTLFLGDPPKLSRCVEVASAREAVDVIKSGGSAVLPAGSWDLADEVLWLLDIGPAWRAHQLHWARTGKIRLPVPALDAAEPAPRHPTHEASGTWPDPPDGRKAGPEGILERELAELERQGGSRYDAVKRMVARATEGGMDRSDAQRRALDETAAADDAFDAMLAKRLQETLSEYPMATGPLEEISKHYPEGGPAPER